MSRRIAGPSGLADRSTAARLTPEDQAQYKPDSERCENRLRRVFAHVLLRVFLKCSDAIPRIAPGLFGFAPRLAPGLFGLSTVLSRHGAGRGFQIAGCGSQILGCFACVGFTAL